jgi:hypothetical protein
MALTENLRLVLTNFFYLSNIRPVSWGSGGMVGTSRCIAATLFKFGGPETLSQAAPSLCVPAADSALLTRRRPSIGVFSARKMVCSVKNTIRGESERRLLRLREIAKGVWAHAQGREAAALFAAAA